MKKLLSIVIALILLPKISFANESNTQLVPDCFYNFAYLYPATIINVELNHNEDGMLVQKVYFFSDEEPIYKLKVYELFKTDVNEDTMINHLKKEANDETVSINVFEENEPKIFYSFFQDEETYLVGAISFYNGKLFIAYLYSYEPISQEDTLSFLKNIRIISSNKTSKTVPEVETLSYDDLVALDVSVHQEMAIRATTSNHENNDTKMLYENEYLSIEFSNIRTKETSYDTYLYTEYLIKNKTDRILYIVCDKIVIDGCTVDISKYIEVPPNAFTIHEWTNDAEQYLKYKIQSPTTLSMMFEYKATDNSFKSGTILSNTIRIEE